MVSVARRFAGYTSLLLIAIPYIAGCGPNRHVLALREYGAGRPDAAERTLAPLLQEGHKDEILYLWDIGMFRFAQGNFLKANEAWLKSDVLAGFEPGALETGSELLASDASKRFIGDPVEYSIAFLYAGLGFYATADYENAIVAFKKSLEWDYSKDQERQGDMAITNTMLAECYSRIGESDEAIVGYKRALLGNPDFVPAYIGICRELNKMGDTSQYGKYLDELSSRVSDDYSRIIDENQQGILVVIMSGAAPEVEKDEYTGAFRKRIEVPLSIARWRIDCGDRARAVEASLADKLITHFQDQGGETGQAVRKAIQAAAGAAMREIPIFGQLFAPSAEADVRYWTTIPGEISAAYVPLEPGLHSIRATAYGSEGESLDDFQQIWHYIPVERGKNTILVLSRTGI